MYSYRNEFLKLPLEISRQYYSTFFSNHGIILVVRVVGISETSISSDFKFHVFMTKSSFVTNVISAVKVLRHNE